MACEAQCTKDGDVIQSLIVASVEEDSMLTASHLPWSRTCRTCRMKVEYAVTSCAWASRDLRRCWLDLDCGFGGCACICGRPTPDGGGRWFVASSD